MSFSAHRPVALVVSLAAWLLASASIAEAQTGTRRLTYAEAFPLPGVEIPDAERIVAEPPDIEGWLDDEAYLERRKEPDGTERILAVTAADGTSRVHVDFVEVARHLPEGAEAKQPAAATPDMRQLIYDHAGDLYEYDVEAARARRLTATPSPEQNPTFSPDGRWIAYTRDHDLYAYDLEGRLEHRLTSDGSDTVYNGWASWVYYEEILGRSSRYAAFWWSPDSTRLAFMRFDDGPVPTFPIYHADGQHGELEVQRYPKAGDPNPLVRMGVSSVADGRITWMDFDEAADHYIAWPFWTPDSKTLMVQWMNRGQDTIRFYNCDPETGRKTQVLEQRQPTWVEFYTDLHYFEDGSFLLRSNVDGWDHLYVYAGDGTLRRRLTEGEWRVMGIDRVDEASGFVYVTARREPTWNWTLMRVKLDGSGVETISEGEGVHRASVSPGGAYVLDTVSTLGSPPVVSVRRADGALVREVASTRTARFAEFAWGRTELFTIPSGDGYDLPAYRVLPPDFDERRPYPVIVSIYGGPDAGTVRNQWLGLAPHYWAQRGVITVSVDHRASGHFGKKGVWLMHRKLGYWETHDYTAAANWLRTQPWVDGTKIGITGGSYGGYMTLMALTADGGAFNFGVAHAPVTDWHLYDTVYTERYMDTPAENPEGYRDGAVLTWIDQYSGLLRLTHGTIDDNVHMQNSLQVVDWLTENDKRFEMTIYPDSRHGIQRSQRAHTARETHDFWVRVLLGGTLEGEPSTAGGPQAAGRR